MKKLDKILIITLIGFLMPAFVIGQNRSINFEKGSWFDIVEKAEKENKIIFLDAYASWCGPCKWMAANVFTNDEVADFFNENFINAKIDMEKGEGVELAKKYQINAYPTLLFIDSKGEALHTYCGAADVKKFISIGNDASDPEKQVSSFVKNYKGGNRDADFVKRYLEVAASACMNVEHIASEYLEGKNEEELLSAANWNILYKYVSSSNNPQFKFLVSNRDKYLQNFSKDSVEKKIFGVFVYELSRMVYSKNINLQKFESLKTEFRNTGLEKAEEGILIADLNCFLAKEDWKNYGKLASEKVDLYLLNNEQELNSIAWTIYENSKDKDLLKKALGWAKRSTELAENHYNLDTLAALYFKTGNKAEAIKTQEMAIALAKADGEPTEEYEQSLKMFKGGK
jgi:thioredoxin-related protein